MISSRAQLTYIACGLWFNKYKVMRPPDKWIKKPGKGRKRKTELDPAGLSEPQSDFPQSDFPQSDFYCDPPSIMYTDAVQPEERKPELSRGGSSEIPEGPPPLSHPRANSEQPASKPTNAKDQWSSTNLDAALHRAIQSSPAGRSFLGTQDSPIDLAAEDLTPKPTRRLLFPSPHNSKHKSLDDTALPGSKPVNSTIIEVANVEEPFLVDKENMPPPAIVDEEDDLAHLFECSPGIFRTPAAARRSTPSHKTPRIGSGGFEDLLKTPTPTRSSLKTLSSNARHAFTPRTCSNNNGSASAFLPTFTSAEKQTFGLSPARGGPTTPSRFANLSSPSRANRGELTPFTRHITQLLAENGNSGSPGRGVVFDFADMGSFISPGRSLDFDKMEFSMQDFESMDFGDKTDSATQQTSTGTIGEAETTS